MASSSAMTTRVLNVLVLPGGSGLRFDEEAIEQVVLRLLELRDAVLHLGAVAHHRIGVPLRLLVLLRRQRGLRHEGPQAGLVGRLSQLGQLVVGDGELVTQLTEACGHLREAAFDEGSGHRGKSTLWAVQAPPAFRLLALPALALAVAACGDGTHAAGAACGPIRRETLDPAYLFHVVNEADADVDYATDPPTSGPHKPTPDVGGVLDAPLSKPVQVGVLERGDVVLQYRPDLDEADRAALEALAGPRVTVAPAPDLDDPIVATAWIHKRTCAAFDRAALQEFVDERVGKGPEG